MSDSGSESKSAGYNGSCWKQRLGLIAHPEGGCFSEVFRSKSLVTDSTGAVKSAITHIYFQLSPGEVSGFHKVAMDEVWNLYQGKGLELFIWDGEGAVEMITLGVEAGAFCHVVRAGQWQAARPLSDCIEPVLCGCSVGPGFDFADFVLMGRDDSLAIDLVEQGFGDLVTGI
ncbi:MAG: hypothetical protein CVV64_17335 [Candidatus Wallbacteria bacterium HGW-Wallbacteria-1]|jgi:hypothetical protein|uniref:DUF985 domain-containing protein n=1 Tax=Candidatus Wallbacteria bacterium HGW-Wallbacteria-1 TaxID=2013854 RepID=A0A2N1PK96_9BACT|nr:MAG: hypothetical protein CVV64_17335 [Candidatus Wallbacteria bacterium HGW-Wallbacteria-1]